MNNRQKMVMTVLEQPFDKKMNGGVDFIGNKCDGCLQAVAYEMLLTTLGGGKSYHICIYEDYGMTIYRSKGNKPHYYYFSTNKKMDVLNFYSTTLAVDLKGYEQIPLDEIYNNIINVDWEKRYKINDFPKNIQYVDAFKEEMIDILKKYEGR